ncbi:Protein of unknown function [Bacillus wiedmannii]|uniref:Uncharacterized protein n=2 Tax=Bacillus cereus group TaxID=86661 RepID=A0A1C4CHT0_BACTU|nr:Protein of unknown function [Bacillus mobilis]SCC17870.1 Protein of unknown function [Bacillus wiedmannii]SCC18588.1 Protein of unknown function [Bacillus thuringiensis]SCL91834.1 Protein of unknown function [Bacillus wiedmannii]SCN07144.1 Protein of unknown function [Bacillus wiedmannii]
MITSAAMIQAIKVVMR